MANEFHGLSVRAANCLLTARFETKEQAKAALESDWYSIMQIKNMGEVCFLEVCAWVGIQDPRPPKRKTPPQASQHTIHAAIKMLERNGYTVTKREP